MIKICQNIEPEYRQEIEQLITLDNAIIERDREEKSKKMLESGIEATEETVKMPSGTFWCSIGKKKNNL